jgi:hypothetical protein
MTNHVVKLTDPEIKQAALQEAVKFTKDSSNDANRVVDIDEIFEKYLKRGSEDE